VHKEELLKIPERYDGENIGRGTRQRTEYVGQFILNFLEDLIA
jgi:hypothetical protein